MKHTIISTAILAACALMTPAAKATDFYLNDGSVISGFIEYQPVNGDSIYTISATKGYIIVPETDAQISKSDREFVKESKLNEKFGAVIGKEWADWANENNSWDMQGNTRGLNFADIRDNRLKHSFSKVHLIGTGAKVTFMFMDATPVKLDILKKNIVKRVYKHRSPLTLSGEKRVYHFKGFDIEGQLVEINNDGTYSVLEDNGMIRTFNKKDINSMEIFAFNPEQPFIEQFEYIDEILTDDNKTHSGIIVYQDFKDGTVRIREEEKPIKVKEIVAFKKHVNRDKKILKDVDIAPGKLLFNNVETNKWLSVKEVNQNIIVEPVIMPDSLWIRVPMSNDHTLNVYAHFTDGENASKWELVKLSQIPLNSELRLDTGIADYLKSEFGDDFARQYLKDKKDIKAYGFTYADIVTRAKTPVISPATRNGVTKITYKSLETGKYVLYNKSTKKAIILDIK